MNETSQVTSSGANGSESTRPRVRPLEDRHARVVPQLGVELPVADVERDDARRTVLQEAVGEAAGRGTDVDTARSGDVDAERAECVRELLAAAGDETRRGVDRELGVGVDLLPGLRASRDQPCEHERLRLRARLGEPALDEQDVEPLLHRGHATLKTCSRTPQQPR